MNEIGFIKYLLIFFVGILLCGCPKNGEMTGDEFRDGMRVGLTGEDDDVNGRVSRGTRGFRDINPNGVIDEFVNPCHSCQNDDQAGRARRSGTKTERNFKKMGGDPKALKHAMCFLRKHKDTRFKSSAGGRVKIKDQCKININQHVFGKGRKGKMFIVNVCTGKVDVMYVSKGYNGFGNGTGRTTPGFHITGGWHHSPSGKVWSPGIKMHGLQKGINDKAWSRGVVIHRGFTRKRGRRINYCRGGMRSSTTHSNGDLPGSCGRSAGCPSVDPANWDKVVRDLKGDSSGGVLMYNYTPSMQKKSSSYCGDNLWK